MGALVFVKSLKKDYSFKLVLKYCRDLGDEVQRRFRREVRLLAEFRGNSKVVEIIAHTLITIHPYFVLRYYPEGDLTTLSDRLRSDIKLQERKRDNHALIALAHRRCDVPFCLLRVGTCYTPPRPDLSLTNTQEHIFQASTAFSSVHVTCNFRGTIPLTRGSVPHSLPASIVKDLHR